MSRRRFTAEEYHGQGAATYEPIDRAGWLVRRAAGLATVSYEGVHHNPDAPRDLQGSGRLVGTWLFDEEEPDPEGLLTSDIELVMDSRLEPDAVIGLHDHADTEEFYYVLDGMLTVRAARTDREDLASATLTAGDVHFLPVGGRHCAQAGPDGTRILVVAARPR